MIDENIWNDYFKFSFIRNPWDLVVSTYHWWKKTKWNDENKTGDKIRALNNFEEYVLSPYLRTNTCSQFVMDGQGHSMVDFIGRYESLTQDFAYICGKVGLPNINMPVKNTSEHTPYQDYYNEKTKEIVKKRFKWDLKNFKYSFD